MSNPNENAEVKTFAEFSSRLATLNLQKNPNFVPEPEEDNLNSLLEQLKEQKEKVKNVTTNINQPPPEIKIDFSTITNFLNEPIFTPSKMEPSLVPACPTHQKDPSSDFNFNLLATHNPGFSSSLSGNIQPNLRYQNKESPTNANNAQADAINFDDQRKQIVKTIQLSEIEDPEEVVLKQSVIVPEMFNNDRKDDNDESKRRSHMVQVDPAGVTESIQRGHEPSIQFEPPKGVNVKESTVQNEIGNSFDLKASNPHSLFFSQVDQIQPVTAKRSENDFVVELGGDENKTESKQQADELVTSVHKEESNFDFNVNEIADDPSKEAEKETDLAFKEEEERLEKERLEKEEEERRETERIKKERLMKEKKEKEDRDRRLREKKEREEREKERERLEKEEKERQEREELERKKKHLKEIERRKKEIADLERETEEKLKKEKEERIAVATEKEEEEESNKSQNNEDREEVKRVSEHDEHREHSEDSNKEKEDEKKDDLEQDNGEFVIEEIESFEEEKKQEKEEPKEVAENSIPAKLKSKPVTSDPKIKSRKNIEKDATKESRVSLQSKESKQRAGSEDMSRDLSKDLSRDYSKDASKKVEDSPRILGQSAVNFLGPEVRKDEVINKQNATILSQIDAQTKNVINELVRAVNDFNVDNPDLEDKDQYTFLTSYDKNEPILPGIVPKLKENVIYTEGSNVLLERREKFLKRKFFENQIRESKDFTKLIQRFKEPHPDLMNDNYDRKKDTFLDDIDKLDRESIFDENAMISDQDPPLGRLQDLSTFVYKYSVHENIKCMVTCYQNFSNWRESEPDGNSFYRVFMFGLLEEYILSKNNEMLEKTILDITQPKYQDRYKENKVDYTTFFAILRLICVNVQEEMYEEAINILIDAYKLKNRCFDKGMIVYLRSVVHEYMTELYDLYDSTKGKKSTEDRISLQGILTLGIEPEFLILCLLPYLFDVNIQFLWVDGDFCFAKEGIVSFVDDTQASLPKIVIGWFFGGYFKLYSREELRNPIFSSIEEKSRIQIEQLTYVPKETKKCLNCKKKTNQIFFLRKKFYTCFTCLENFLKKTIEKRAKAFYLSAFLGLEYYTRPIHLKDNFYVDDYEFIEIFQDYNIINALYVWITTSCFSCNTPKAAKDLKVMKCMCRYCETCFNQKYEKATQKYKVLNRYEKSTFDPVICECNRNFDVDDALRLRTDISDKDYQNAQKRMKNYINTLCMICTSEIDTSSKGKGNKYKEIKIMPENDERRGLDYLDCPHKMCIPCYNKEKEKIFSEYLSKEAPKKEGEDPKKAQPQPPIKSSKVSKLSCKICKKKHLINKSTFSKNSEGACCQGGCTII